MKRKPTTTTISLWNVTGAITITTHADEPHKSVALVDFTVNLGDEDTARDLIHGVCKILQLPDPSDEFLVDLIIHHPEKLLRLAREWNALRVIEAVR